MDLILLERLLLFKWFRSKRPFSTGGGQYKQAVRSQSGVTTTAE